MKKWTVPLRVWPVLFLQMFDKSLLRDEIQNHKKREREREREKILISGRDKISIQNEDCLFSRKLHILL